MRYKYLKELIYRVSNAHSTAAKVLGVNSKLKFLQP